MDSSSDLIRSNPHLTAERAPVVLQGQTWHLAGDGGLYAKSAGMCLEHPCVADVALALDMLGILWSAGTDRDNCVTFSVPASHRTALEAYVGTVQANDALPSGRQGTSPAR